MLQTKSVIIAWVLANKEHASDYHGYDAGFWNYIPLLFASKQEAEKFLSLLKMSSDKIEEGTPDEEFYSPAQEPWDVSKFGVITQKYRYVPFLAEEISRLDLEILSIEEQKAIVQMGYSTPEEWRIFSASDIEALIEEFRIKALN